MFNCIKLKKTNLIKPKRTLYFSRSNNSLVNRFINFTFSGNNIKQRKLLNLYYTKILSSLNFTSRKTTVNFNYIFNNYTKQFSWLFLYIWKINLISGSSRVKYIEKKFKCPLFLLTLTRYQYIKYEFKFINYTYSYGKFDNKKNWDVSNCIGKEFLFFSKLIYGKLNNSNKLVLVSNKVNYPYWNTIYTKNLFTDDLYRYDIKFKLTNSMYKKSNVYLKSLCGVKFFKKLNSNSMLIFFKKNKVLDKFKLLFKLLYIENCNSYFNILKKTPIGLFLYGKTFSSYYSPQLTTDPSLYYIRLFYSKRFYFTDMIPHNYIYNLLIISKNRISPFAIKNKTFISQREVHFSSICFFIEKGSLIRKNSYFLGLVLGGLKEKNFISTKVYKLLNYNFYKNPYTLNNRFNLLS